MERAEFLAKFGLGLAAVCAGCTIASCGSKGSDPTPGGAAVGGATPPPAQGSGNLFTIDLGSQLTNIGDSATSKGVIVVRLAAGNAAASFTALQIACTHEGTAIAYNEAQQRFICPAHGSEFSNSGLVLVGPAALPLREYTVAVDNTTLTVSA
ncbi:MAG TPA: Rieske 2Fe-2S domain-containing protein [Mucilaginibacter sp.]|jgi:cytochrome b6-f complex iron-sulfur subunit|nr:Rieske 2Fe-2S domain-containing protein [Mucilaginibacter sp.]